MPVTYAISFHPFQSHFTFHFIKGILISHFTSIYTPKRELGYDPHRPGTKTTPFGHGPCRPSWRDRELCASPAGDAPEPVSRWAFPDKRPGISPATHPRPSDVFPDALW